RHLHAGDVGLPSLVGFGGSGSRHGFGPAMLLHKPPSFTTAWSPVPRSLTSKLPSGARSDPKKSTFFAPASLASSICFLNLPPRRECETESPRDRSRCASASNPGRGRVSGERSARK